MFSIRMESNEKAALAKLHGTTIHGLFQRLLADLDRGNRVQRDKVLLRQGQGRGLMIEDILAEIDVCSRRDTL